MSPSSGHFYFGASVFSFKNGADIASHHYYRSQVRLWESVKSDTNEKNRCEIGMPRHPPLH